MSKVSKNAKVLISLVLLVLAFCCSFNITNSYFTASSNRSGTLQFSDLNVKFLAMDDDFNIVDESSTITLYPMASAIIRGQAFSLSLTAGSDQDAIGRIAIRNTTNSISAYVRFWIDAYIMTDSATGAVDTTTNYGEYFLLNPGNTNSVRGGSANANATEGDWCYYVKNVMNPFVVGGGAQNTTVYLGNTLELSSSASDEVFDALVGNQIKISINLEAVQSANSAYSSAFNDEKGYYSTWK